MTYALNAACVVPVAAFLQTREPLSRLRVDRVGAEVFDLVPFDASYMATKAVSGHTKSHTHQSIMAQ